MKSNIGRHYIEPEDRHQATLFSTLDDAIEADNYVRLLDLLVDQVVEANPDKFLRRGLNNIGRRAYSPHVLLKLFLYGYLNGISSSRKLERQTQLNIEVMWLLGRLSPDHKTIADYRKDHGQAIKFVTLQFTEFLIHQKYISGQKVVLDGTKIKANAARQKFMRTKNLEKRIHEIESKLDQYLNLLQRNDTLDDAEQEEQDNDGINQRLIDKISELEQELSKVKADRKELKTKGFDKIHLTDPDCRKMVTKHDSFPAYNFQMITGALFGFIIYSEVVQNPGDGGLAGPMVNRMRKQTKINPRHFFADKGYYNIKQLHDFAVLDNIRPWVAIPVRRTEKKDRENKIRFTYRPQTDDYLCSQGKVLHFHQFNNYYRTKVYKGSECGSCEAKSRCTKAKNRSKEHTIHKQWYDLYIKRMKSPLGKWSTGLRQAWVEHPFGTIKSWMGKIPIKMRGIANVQTEMNLYTTAYNYKRLTAIGTFEQVFKEVKEYNWKAS